MTRTALAGTSADRLVELENQVRSLRSDLQQLRTTATPTGAEGLGRPCRVVGPVTPGDDTFDVIWLDGEFTETKGANSVVWFDRQATSAGVAHTIDGSTLVADSVYYAHFWSDRWWIPISAGGTVTPGQQWFTGVSAFDDLTNVIASVHEVIPFDLTPSTASPMANVTWHGTPDYALEFAFPGITSRDWSVDIGGVAQGSTQTSKAEVSIEISASLASGWGSRQAILRLLADTTNADRTTYGGTFNFQVNDTTPFLRFMFGPDAGQPDCDLHELYMKMTETV
jgi:hypothetical protein